MRSFVKIKSSRNDEITLSIAYIGKSCTSREFLAPQECLLTLFAKISGFTVASLWSSASWFKTNLATHLEDRLYCDEAQL